MILVTGGTGLIGRFLLKELCEKGEKVRAIHRKNSDIVVLKKNYSSIDWVETDILDMEGLNVCFKGITKVYHSAALVSLSSHVKEKMYKVNIEGTANIVNLCLEKKVQKLCHVSSIAAMGGNSNGELINEKNNFSIDGDETDYSITKYLSELEVWRGISEGLNAVIVNPSFVFGPGDWNNSSTQLFKYIWDEHRFYTKGGNGFVDVRDVVKAMILLMESDICGQRFIISSENLKIKEIFDLMAKYFNKKPPTIKASQFLTWLGLLSEHIACLFTGKKPVLSMDSIKSANKVRRFSNEKIIKQFNFSFIPLEETIQWTCLGLIEEFKKNNVYMK